MYNFYSKNQLDQNYTQLSCLQFVNKWDGCTSRRTRTSKRYSTHYGRAFPSRTAPRNNKSFSVHALRLIKQMQIRLASSFLKTLKWLSGKKRILKQRPCLPCTISLSFCTTYPQMGFLYRGSLGGPKGTHHAPRGIFNGSTGVLETILVWNTSRFSNKGKKVFYTISDNLHMFQTIREFDLARHYTLRRCLKTWIST